MITKMHVENFRCFKDFSTELGPFNVLIGPNGSGKSSLLKAIEILRESVREPRGRKIPGFGLGFGDYNLWKPSASCALRFEIVAVGKKVKADVIVVGDTEKGFEAGECVDGEVPKPVSFSNGRRGIIEELATPIPVLDLSPEALKNTSELSEAPLFSSNGKGLPVLLNNIYGQDREAFLRLEDAFCDRFREYKRVLIAPQPGRKEGTVGLALFFKTSQGRDLPADVISDGAIRFLAFLTLEFIPSSPKTLLVEEPENGVHYERLKEIVGILRKLQTDKGTQVIMATHSPYLLDLVEPNEVLVFEKDNEGAAHCKRLSEFGDVEKLKGYFGTGEIWTEFPEKDIVFGKGKDAGK